jgi:hypothetical protein
VSRCEHCPVKADKTCLGDAHPEAFPHFCRWATSREPREREMVVLRSAVGYTTPEQVESTPVAAGPGLLTRAANFGKAIVSHVAAGRPAADAATVEARWATCRACPMFDAAGVVCRACGCHLEIKIRWAEQCCPIGKW